MTTDTAGTATAADMVVGAAIGTGTPATMAGPLLAIRCWPAVRGATPSFGAAMTTPATPPPADRDRLAVARSVAVGVVRSSTTGPGLPVVARLMAIGASVAGRPATGLRPMLIWTGPAVAVRPRLKIEDPLSNGIGALLGARWISATGPLGGPTMAVTTTAGEWSRARAGRKFGSGPGTRTGLGTTTGPETIRPPALIPRGRARRLRLSRGTTTRPGGPASVRRPDPERDQRTKRPELDTRRWLVGVDWARSQTVRQVSAARSRRPMFCRAKATLAT